MKLVTKVGEVLYDLWDSFHDHHYDDDLGDTVTDGLNISDLIPIISFGMFIIALAKLGAC